MEGYRTEMCKIDICNSEVSGTAREKVRIRSELSLSAVSIQRIFTIAEEWEIDAEGSVSLTLTAEKNPEFPELPRFGIRLFLPKHMNQVEYYGMGPCESYIDKHQGSLHGKYGGEVEELFENYIKPQENGSHYDCEYVRVKSGDRGIAVTAEAPFSFNCSHYSQEEMTQKQHNFELEESDSTILCIDYAQAGIGSNSCGPELLEQYRLEECTIRFSCRFIPQ